MKWEDIVVLKGVNYKFESIEDDPLVFIMTIDERYYLQRQITCDEPTERITLVKKYKSVKNGIEKDDTFNDQVYHGQEIRSVEFMTTLLEHVLYGII